MKNKLSDHELEFIKEREEVVKETLNELKKVQEFKVDDYLIAFRKEYYSNKVTQVKNSYDAPKKYQVVHVDSNGIPYIKELNKKGSPIGQLMCPVDVHEGGGRIVRNTDMRFEVDPDYTDSIIMMDEENYDSSQVHRMKSDTFKEITEHNKKHKVKCGDLKEVAEFFSTVTSGMVLYKSIKTHFTVLEINAIPRDSANRLKGEPTFMKIQDSKGKINNVSLKDFQYKALYTARPRSYNELKDPK